jgi:hypothetical protein
VQFLVNYSLESVNDSVDETVDEDRFKVIRKHLREPMMVAPPCCVVCGHLGIRKGQLQSVQFTDYDPSWTTPDWDDTGSSHNSMGVHGPEGLGMFCLTHLEGAMQLRRLTLAEAVARLQKESTTSTGNDPYPEGS